MDQSGNEVKKKGQRKDFEKANIPSEAKRDTLPGSQVSKATVSSSNNPFDPLEESQKVLFQMANAEVVFAKMHRESLAWRHLKGIHVDNASKYFFPLTFGIFCTVYFLVYQM